MPSSSTRGSATRGTSTKPPVSSSDPYHGFGKDLVGEEWELRW